MKAEKLLKALSEADEKYIREAAPQKDLEEPETSHIVMVKRNYGKWIGTAACVGAAVGGIAAFGIFGGTGNLNGGISPLASESGSAQTVELTADEYTTKAYEIPSEAPADYAELHVEELLDTGYSDYIPLIRPYGYVLSETSEMQQRKDLGFTSITLDFIKESGENGFQFIVTIYDEAIPVSAGIINPIALSDLTPESLSDLSDYQPIYIDEKTEVTLMGNLAEVSGQKLYDMIMSMPCTGNTDPSYEETSADESAACKVYSLDELRNTECAEFIPPEFIPKSCPDGYIMADTVEVSHGKMIDCDDTNILFRFKKEDGSEGFDLLIISYGLEKNYVSSSQAISKQEFSADSLKNAGFSLNIDVDDYTDIIISGNFHDASEQELYDMIMSIMP